MMEQRIHQRAGIVPGGGMHDHACRLVDDDDVRVLVDDRQVQILGSWGGVPELGNLELDRSAGLEPVIRFGRAAVDLDQALLDQLLQVRTRLSSNDRYEKPIE